MTEIEAIEEMSHYSEEEYGKGAVAESHKMAIIALEEIQQYRAFKEIFESHLSAEVVKLLSDKEEFAKWLDRGKWIAKKCDELGRELEKYQKEETVKNSVYRNVFDTTATISTAHILPETSELLEKASEEAFGISGVTVIKKNNFGYFLYPAEELFDETLPADLKVCLDFAKAHGCSCLCFDTDGEILSELPDYSEEWEKPRPKKFNTLG